MLLVFNLIYSSYWEKNSCCQFKGRLEFKKHFAEISTTDLPSCILASCGFIGEEH